MNMTKMQNVLFKTLWLLLYTNVNFFFFFFVKYHATEKAISSETLHNHN